MRKFFNHHYWYWPVQAMVLPLAPVQSGLKTGRDEAMRAAPGCKMERPGALAGLDPALADAGAG